MFIKLTQVKTGIQYYIRASEILVICPTNEGSMLATSAQISEYKVKETPEQIMSLIEGKADTPAVPLHLIVGTFEWAMAWSRAGHGVIMPGWPESVTSLSDLIHEAQVDRSIMESNLWELWP